MIYELICETIYRMQHHDMSKTPGRFKVGFFDPLTIAQDQFTYNLTKEDLKNLSVEGPKELKCRRTIQKKEKDRGCNEDRYFRLHYKGIFKFARQRLHTRSL